MKIPKEGSKVFISTTNCYKGEGTIENSMVTTFNSLNKKIIYPWGMVLSCKLMEI